MSITIVGKAEIPEHSNGVLAPIKDAREVVNNLEEGKATVIETDSAKQGKQFQSMLHIVAEIKFGGRGRIKTKRLENVVYVWLHNPENEPA